MNSTAWLWLLPLLAGLLVGSTVWAQQKPTARPSAISEDATGSGQAVMAVIEDATKLAADGYLRAGDWRVMGYNSPMVPAEQRFWELQVPVSRRLAQVKPKQMNTIRI